MIEIAKILKPQGLKGEVKLEMFSTDLSTWQNLSFVKISGQVYEVENVRFYKTFAYLKLKEVSSIDEAERLRNKKVFVERNDLKTEEGEYIISDLEKCKVEDENGNLVGFVESVEQYGSADIINILIGGELKSFPFLKKVIKVVDLKSNVIVVFKDKLDEVLI